MRDYRRLREIVQYCKSFQESFFEYLDDSITADDKKVLDILEEYADWSDHEQDGRGFSAWEENI